jgi:hypothetical protein
MKTRFVFYLFISAAVPLFLIAADTGETGFPKLKGWKLTVSPDVYTPENLWDLIDGAAESYLSYDFIDLHLADYENKGGTVIHVEIYRHNTLDDAFGIYSSERNPGSEFLDIGVQGYRDEGVLNFFTGPFYIKLYSTGSGKEVQESLGTVARAVSGHLGQGNDWPGMLGAFPPEGKLENRDHFVRENFIGLNFLHSAFTAEYEGNYKLFVIVGRDSDEIMEMAAAYLQFTKQDIDPAKESSFIIKDRYNGDIPVVLKGSFMAGIIDGAGNADAHRNLDSLVRNLDALVRNLEPLVRNLVDL